MSDPYDLVDAINLLRPEFNARVRLQAEFAIMCADKTTYFATIPADLHGIIREFIPDLRISRSHIPRTSPDYPFVRDASACAEFFAKYTHASSTKHKRYVDLGLLQRDYPDKFTNVKSKTSVWVKSISGDLDVRMHKHNYIGHNRVMIYSGTHSSTEFNVKYRVVDRITGKKICKRISRGVCSEPLPCGLIIIATKPKKIIPDNDFFEYYLTDIVTSERIRVWIHDIRGDKMWIVDDYGTTINIQQKLDGFPEITDDAYYWSELSCEYLHIRCK